MKKQPPQTVEHPITKETIYLKWSAGDTFCYEDSKGREVMTIDHDSELTKTFRNDGIHESTLKKDGKFVWWILAYDNDNKIICTENCNGIVSYRNRSKQIFDARGKTIKDIQEYFAKLTVSSKDSDFVKANPDFVFKANPWNQSIADHSKN